MYFWPKTNINLCSKQSFNLCVMTKKLYSYCSGNDCHGHVGILHNSWSARHSGLPSKKVSVLGMFLVMANISCILYGLHIYGDHDNITSTKNLYQVGYVINKNVSATFLIQRCWPLTHTYLKQVICQKCSLHSDSLLSHEMCRWERQPEGPCKVEKH